MKRILIKICNYLHKSAGRYRRKKMISTYWVSLNEQRFKTMCSNDNSYGDQAILHILQNENNTQSDKERERENFDEKLDEIPN